MRLHVFLLLKLSKMPGPFKKHWLDNLGSSKETKPDTLQDMPHTRTEWKYYMVTDKLVSSQTLFQDHCSHRFLYYPGHVSVLYKHITRRSYSLFAPGDQSDCPHLTSLAHVTAHIPPHKTHQSISHPQTSLPKAWLAEVLPCVATQGNREKLLKLSFIICLQITIHYYITIHHCTLFTWTSGGGTVAFCAVPNPFLLKKMLKLITIYYPLQICPFKSQYNT